MIYPIGERARGAYSGTQSLLRLRSPEKDSGSGDQSLAETLHEFSYMSPPNMEVVVFCTSPGSMYPGNLAGAMVERGRLSARSADSSLPPDPAEKTRIRTSSGAVGGQSPPVNRGNRGNAGVCGEKIRWSSKKIQPLMSRFPSGAVEFSPYLAEFSPCLAEFSPCLAEFSPFLAEIFPCVAEFSPYLAECLPFWRNVARSGGVFAWSGGVFAFYLAWWAFD